MISQRLEHIARLKHFEQLSQNKRPNTKRSVLFNLLRQFTRKRQIEFKFHFIEEFFSHTDFGS